MLGGSRCGPKVSALFVVALSGCQGDYPIAPTDCDRWCNTALEVDCYDVDPAGCVADCEQQGLTSNRKCTETFTVALDCLQSVPASQRSCSGPMPCATEHAALWTCVSGPR
jgi:hypothetical protein